MEKKDEKVTRDALRLMQEGETKVFYLPSAQACDAGKATVYQTQNYLRCRFTCTTDYVNTTLTVTRTNDQLEAKG